MIQHIKDTAKKRATHLLDVWKHSDSQPTEITLALVNLLLAPIATRVELGPLVFYQIMLVASGVYQLMCVAKGDLKCRVRASIVTFGLFCTTLMMYVITIESFVDGLIAARQRGVDVRVIIPSRGNHGPLNASNKLTINTLLQHGIRVYEYPGMSHIKAAIYDGWMCVGSANFDKLSLKINKEIIKNMVDQSAASNASQNLSKALKNF